MRNLLGGRPSNGTYVFARKVTLPRRLTMAAALVLGVGLLLAGAGCGGTSSTEGGGGAGGAEARIVVEFWHAMSGDHERLISDMAADFMEANPDVEVRPTYQGAYNQLKVGLSNNLAAGKAPAMAQVYETWTSLFLEKDQIAPVQKFIDAEPDGYKATLDDIYPRFLDNNRWDGQLVTLPFNKSAYLIIYNVDRFNNAGYKTFPTTMEGMFEAAEKLTDRDANGEIRCYGIGLRATLEPFTEQLLAYGGGYLVEEGGGMALFQRDHAIKALNDLVRLNIEKKVAFVTPEYLSSPFGSDTIAFFSGSSAGIPFVAKGVGDKFAWAAAPMPDASGDGTGRHLFQGTNIAIFSLVAEEKQQAAWRFLKFMLEPAQAARWAAESGYLPVRRAALKEKSLADYAATSQPYQVCVEMLESAAFEPKVRYWEEVRNEIVTEFDSALQGRKPVAEAVDNMLQKGASIMASHEKGR